MKLIDYLKVRYKIGWLINNENMIKELLKKIYRNKFKDDDNIEISMLSNFLERKVYMIKKGKVKYNRGKGRKVALKEIGNFRLWKHIEEKLEYIVKNVEEKKLLLNENIKPIRAYNLNNKMLVLFFDNCIEIYLKFF